MKNVSFIKTVRLPKEPPITVKSALICLLLVALIGCLMRGAPFFQLYFPYDHWLHTHSHLGMLGWGYLALLAGIRMEFLQGISSKAYNGILAGTLLCVLGMTGSFPVQGYAFWSILFSSLFLVASYFLVGFFFKANGWRGGTPSQAFLRAAMGYLVLSSLGAWALGPIAAQGLKDEPIYRLCIYGYLHFQYNGWMTFALLGLLFRIRERKGMDDVDGRVRKGFWWLHAACVPAYGLSTLWAGPGASVFLVSGAAALAQLIAFAYVIRPLEGVTEKCSAPASKLFRIAILAFGAKFALQFLSAFPYFAELAFLQRDFVIGYLHLVLLGFISFGLLGYFGERHWLADRLPLRIGLTLFFAAFLLTELLIFYRGGMAAWGLPNLPFLEEMLFGFSILFPLGVGLVGWNAR